MNTSRLSRTQLLAPPVVALTLFGGLFAADQLQQVATATALPSRTASASGAVQQHAGQTTSPETTSATDTATGEQLGFQQVSLQDCITVAKGIQRTTHADFWGAISAARATGGCGDTNAGAICYASRTWWGGWARWIVSTVTNGMTDRC